MGLFGRLFNNLRDAIVRAFGGDPRYTQHFDWDPTQGGGGGSYTAGDGIDISSNRISAKVDDSTIKVNGSGQLYSTASGDVTKAYVDTQDQALQTQIDGIKDGTDIDSFADVEAEIASIDAAMELKADKSTTLAGYGITNAYTKTETDDLLDDKADKATTLSGYGITDAYTKTETDTELAKKLDKRTTGVEVYSHSDATQGAFTVKTAMSSSPTDTNMLTEKAVDTYSKELIKVSNVNNPGSIQNGTGLSGGTNYDSSVTPRLVKMGKFAFFSAQLKWTSSSSSANWTSIYALSSGNRPVRTTPVVVQVYNNGSNEAAGGTIGTNGTITLWTNTKLAGNNYQVRIACCFELA